MATEDLTTYTEVDPDNRVVVTTTRCTTTNEPGTETATWVYKDKDAGHFGDFEHKFDLYMTSMQNGSCMAHHTVSNIVESWTDAYGANHQGLSTRTNCGSGGDKIIAIRDFNSHNSDAFTNLIDTNYYCTAERNSTTYTLKIYSDSGRTTLLDTLSLTCTTTTLRYIFAHLCYDQAATYGTQSGYLENLDLQEIPAAPTSPALIGCTLTTDTYDVDINIVNRVDFSVSKNVVNYVFADDTDEQLDEGKNIDQITLHCTQNSNHIESTTSLNNMMDNQETAILSGLDDTNLNTDYLIKNLSYNQKPAESAAGIYNISITLERIHDVLPYSEM